ncbi:complex I NDUFA9 subunit family protein [Glycocaulis profundi]|nr:complex I NDUFA9 subunit family protein [Glycocaulis profundi]
MTVLRDEMITLFGGSGFVGRYVARALAKAGYRVRVATRNPHLAYFLKPMGAVGQIQLVQANVRDADSVARAIDGAWGVVNLVGILSEGGRQTFAALQARGAGAVAQAARDAGIERFVQISAIGADADSPSKYARTKAEGERLVREALPGAVILRPSIVFGTEDGFYNKFADMARFTPALPLIGGGKTRFQPIHVADVAAAAVSALENPAHRGRTFELGGPRTYSFKEVLEYITATIQRPRLLAPLPFPVAGAIGAAGEMAAALPFVQAPLTRDQVEMLKSDNVVGAGGEGLGTIADFGITPATVESIVPSYLYRYRKGGQFAQPA